jgi:glycine cleavage system H protein
MSNVPEELKYATTHEWSHVDEDGVVTVGITDHAQDLLGDIVFVEVPEVGTQVAAADEVGVIESVKAASDIYSPVAGEIIEVNELLQESPEIVNSDPYGDGWFFKIKMADDSDLEKLLTADEYAEQCDAEE